MTDHSALIERLEANEPLPICPYDRRSPEYWTTNDTDPCKFCGTKNEEGAPDLCRGADTRLFAEAAAALRDQQDRHEGMEEDLYQAVLVAYRRGAVEWTRLNYPKWFGWIKDGRACLPSAPNQAKALK